jgi:hypothetical protein
MWLATPARNFQGRKNKVRIEGISEHELNIQVFAVVMEIKLGPM